jgi:hypothetical protein
MSYGIESQCDTQFSLVLVHLDENKWKGLTLIQPGEVKVDLANFDVKFRTKFFYVGFFLNWPIPAKTSYKSFLTSDMTSKNDVLTSILTFFRQKFCLGATIPTSPLRTGFTPSAGEVLPGRGPQCDAAPGNIPINFSSRAA